MSRLSVGLLRVPLCLGALALWMLAAANGLAAHFGETTLADAYHDLSGRAPAWAQGLFASPWWMPLIGAVPMTGLLIWPAAASAALPPAEAGSAEPPVRGEPEVAYEDPPPNDDLDGVDPFSNNPYLREEHIYAGSARLSLVPEFRAVTVKYISRAKIFIDYSSYSGEFHRWQHRTRILVGEIHDQAADEWSVVNIALMTFYESDLGLRTWRWAREFEDGPPLDEAYAFSIDNHYQGRVVFAASDGVEYYSYFVILPARDFLSDMPNLVSQGVFKFLVNWERIDREAGSRQPRSEFGRR